MGIIKNNKFVGGRILKTGIAVLLTSILCYSLKWPEMFAVIAAIVTVEPTAKDSIEKALIRFPASAIGAAYSVLFTFLFGDRPFTYTLVALGTIFTCNKLRLHSGILVATLTGVAMISTVHHQYILSFFVRLGTTSIGLIVSSLVNLLLIHPDYSKDIQGKTKQLFIEVTHYFEKRGLEIINQEPLHKGTRMMFKSLVKNLETIQTLCSYQRKEWEFHHFPRKIMRIYHYENKKICILHQIINHLGILNSFPALKTSFNHEVKQIMNSSIELIKKINDDDPFEFSESNQQMMNKILGQLKLGELDGKDKQYHQSFHYLPPETLLLFELVSILGQMEEIKRIQRLELRDKRNVNHYSLKDEHFQ